ncbi:MAG TPA: flagellar FlbD family protein [Bacillota bacterium]|nr:flagellar FlbD family protein [Bacillota bacterium]
MIAVKRLNGEEIFLNPHLIETIEATPDTVVTLTTGKRLVVKEATAEIVAKIIQYRQTIGEKFFTDYDNREL